jgi:drug/metabolite transporter (DMT)-like permease
MTAGFWGVGVQLFLAAGLEKADAVEAMVMSYTGIVWVEIAGVLLFHEFPTIWSLIGIVVIIAGSLHCGINCRDGIAAGGIPHGTSLSSVDGRIRWPKQVG